VIQVAHLTRRFGAVLAVDDISFEITRGEVVGFLGPNGAGKTTTMRILSGYLPATSGAVQVAGHDVLRRSMEVRRRIGYLPEAVPLYRELRVEEMLDFQARLHGIPRRERRRRVAAVLVRVGLVDRARQLVGALSRGLRQRAGLAVALLPEPDVLILDEPTSGLDPVQRIEVRQLISQLSAEHTVLLSSHILPEIEAVCPRVIVLHRGRVAADGTQEQLVRQLGGGSRVRVEVAVGAESDAAAARLGRVSGVRGVTRALPADSPREGAGFIAFELACEEDLREPVGALVREAGWPLRELSWRRPTLERLFARIALDLEEGAPGPGGSAATSAESSAAASAGASAPGETLGRDQG
jgi:ABC-2 type transport system ATP-binding protein